MRFGYVPISRINKIPSNAGVYVLKSSQEILYIGKAANLRDRVRNHFKQSSYRDNLFINQVSKIGYIETPTDIDALLLESELIKQYQPKYNVMWRDDKKYFYVAITKDTIPVVYLTHQPVPKLKVKSEKLKVGFIGPFVDGKALKRTLRLLRRAFPYRTARTHPKIPCSYCQLGLCPGFRPDANLYQKNLQKLTAVLQGKRISVLRALQKDMENAAQQQEFEMAARLRDQFFSLSRIFEHASLFSRRDEGLAEKNYSEAEKVLQNIFRTKKSFSRIEAYDISNIQGAQATGSMIVFADGVPARDLYRKFKIRSAGKPNDFAMMQELVSRRLLHPEWGYPNLMIIDGGKPQLSAAMAACKILRRSRESSTRSGQDAKYKIQIAALAKRHNELFLRSVPEPLLLKNLPAVLRNLILHIRDEAHRFAISYHRILRRVDLLGKRK